MQLLLLQSQLLVQIVDRRSQPSLDCLLLGDLTFQLPSLQKQIPLLRIRFDLGRQQLLVTP
jgi:hypothetical protein